MTKLIWAISIPLIIGAYPALAQDSKLETSWEMGKISTSEILEEEDLSSDLTYHKARLGISQNFSRQLNWSLTNTLYRKEYDSQHSLSNNYNQALLAVNYLPQKETYLIPQELRLRYKNKEKRYDHLPEERYSQNNLELEAIYGQKSWRLAIAGGVNDFHYHANNEDDETQSYFNIELKKKLFGDKLALYGLARIKNIRRSGESDKNQDIWGAQAHYKIGLPNFEEIVLSAQKGKAETLDEEGRDDKYDYKYLDWYVKTQHPVSEKLDLTFKYQRTERAYFKWDKSWYRIYLEADAQYKIFDDKIKNLTLDLKTYHKKLDFFTANSSDFYKNGTSFELKFNQKGSFKVGCGFSFNRKESELSPSKSRDAFSWKVQGEKTFSNITLFLDYKHELKDYDYASDRTYDVIKGGMELKF